MEVKSLKDFEKVILFLYCAQTGEPRNERTLRMLFDWDKERYDTAIAECIERDFITHSEFNDVLNESLLVEPRP